MLSTASYQERALVFNKLNPMTHRSNIRPQSAYLGRPPLTGRDKYDRRIVPTLDDVSVGDNGEEDDADYDDPEELLNLKRMRHTVLNEENMAKILNEDTEALDLEAKYWIGEEFIDKIGIMAKNLTELSLRRMNHIRNVTFASIFKDLNSFEAIDLSDCEGLQTSALHLMMTTSQQTL